MLPKLVGHRKVEWLTEAPGSSRDSADSSRDQIAICSRVVAYSSGSWCQSTRISPIHRSSQRLQDCIPPSAAPQSGRDGHRFHVSLLFIFAQKRIPSLSRTSPLSSAFAIGAGIQAAAAGGMYAVARIRITRYLERVNKEYFMPRGLLARIAKQNSLPQILGQPPDAPLLAPIPLTSDQTVFPSLRDRRMQALGRYVAPIQYLGSSNVSEEGNLLDKLSAKMTQRSATKAENKMNKDHMKNMKDARKDGAKIEEKMAKARAKGKTSKLAKLEGERAEIHGEGMGGGSTAKEEKAARKFMFVVVHNLQ